MATIIPEVSFIVCIFILTFLAAMLLALACFELYPWVKKRIRPEAEPFTIADEDDVSDYGPNGLYVFVNCLSCGNRCALEVKREKLTQKRFFFGLRCYHCGNSINVMVKKYVRPDR